MFDINLSMDYSNHKHFIPIYKSNAHIFPYHELRSRSQSTQEIYYLITMHLLNDKFII